MDFEKLNLQSVVSEKTENSVEEEPLSSDYQNIRNEALAIIDMKLDVIKEKLGANAPELAAYKAAQEKLSDNKYIINQAKVNNWEKIRGQVGDPEEIDRKLAQGLVASASSLH